MVIQNSLVSVFNALLTTQIIQLHISDVNIRAYNGQQSAIGYII